MILLSNLLLSFSFLVCSSHCTQKQIERDGKPIGELFVIEKTDEQQAAVDETEEVSTVDDETDNHSESE